jgi:hypothetical protein
MLRQPDAPAPTAIASKAARASTGCTAPGAVAMPVSAVTMTSDITRGFSSAKKSRASPVEAVRLSVRVSNAADISRIVFVLL